mmetsp:Transcript_16819/g.42695  ORF Transcript_16819/g.42695 Transcript_16819/m.42695 type:complete len:378 (-) Transcript_16819:82-1215(-)
MERFICDATSKNSLSLAALIASFSASCSSSLRSFSSCHRRIRSSSSFSSSALRAFSVTASSLAAKTSSRSFLLSIWCLRRFSRSCSACRRIMSFICSPSCCNSSSSTMRWRSRSLICARISLASSRWRTSRPFLMPSYFCRSLSRSISIWRSRRSSQAFSSFSRSCLSRICDSRILAHCAYIILRRMFFTWSSDSMRMSSARARVAFPRATSSSSSAVRIVLDLRSASSCIMRSLRACALANLTFLSSASSRFFSSRSRCEMIIDLAFMASSCLRERTTSVCFPSRSLRSRDTRPFSRLVRRRLTLSGWLDAKSVSSTLLPCATRWYPRPNEAPLRTLPRSDMVELSPARRPPPRPFSAPPRGSPGALLWLPLARCR